jgi:hypothetical protein
MGSKAKMLHFTDENPSSREKGTSNLRLEKMAAN